MRRQMRRIVVLLPCLMLLSIGGAASGAAFPTRPPIVPVEDVAALAAIPPDPSECTFEPRSIDEALHLFRVPGRDAVAQERALASAGLVVKDDGADIVIGGAVWVDDRVVVGFGRPAPDGRAVEPAVIAELNRSLRITAACDNAGNFRAALELGTEARQRSSPEPYDPAAPEAGGWPESYFLYALLTDQGPRSPAQRDLASVVRDARRLDNGRIVALTTDVYLPDQGPDRPETVGAVVFAYERGAWRVDDSVASGIVDPDPAARRREEARFNPDGPLAPTVNLRSPAVRWQAQVFAADSLAPDVSAPVAAGGRIFVTDGDVLVAADAATGAEAWRREIDADARFLVDRDTVYLFNIGGGRGCDLSALDAATGEMDWTNRVDCVRETEPVIVVDGVIVLAEGVSPKVVDQVGGRLYLASSNAIYLDGRDAASGERVWQAALPGGSLHILELATGDLRWSFDLPNGRPTGRPLALGDSTLIVDDAPANATSDGDQAPTATLFYLDAATGQDAWQFPVPAGFELATVWGHVALGMVGGDLVGVDLQSNRTDSPIWRLTGVSRPIGAGDLALVVTSADCDPIETDPGCLSGESDLVAININNGGERWRYRLADELVESRLTLARELLQPHDSGSSGAIYALGARSGYLYSIDPVTAATGRSADTPATLTIEGYSRCDRGSGSNDSAAVAADSANQLDCPPLSGYSVVLQAGFFSWTQTASINMDGMARFIDLPPVAVFVHQFRPAAVAASASCVDARGQAVQAVPADNGVVVVLTPGADVTCKWVDLPSR